MVQEVEAASPPPAPRIFVEPMAATALPRGGSYVGTALGAVQVGIPPETIKDSLSLGLAVPQYYVIPRERFYRELGNSLGINVAEFEFPAYYNFFLKNQKVKLIVEREEEEARIRAVLQETLFGPKDADPRDFAPGIPPENRPDLAKETEYFSRYNGQQLSLDSLVSFVRMEGGVATIHGKPGTATEGMRVEISISQDHGGEYVIEEIMPGSKLAGRTPVVSAAAAVGAGVSAGADGAGGSIGDCEGTDRAVIAGGDSGGGGGDVDAGKGGDGAAGGGSGGGGSVVVGKVEETRRANDVSTNAAQARRVSGMLNGEAAGQRGIAVPGRSGVAFSSSSAPASVSSSFGGATVRHPVEMRRRAVVSMFIHLPEHTQHLPSHRPLQPASSADPAGGGSNKAPEFKPPVFGVTVLGNSHGFDPAGSTSGYVLWINRRGYMIDPPPYASMILASYEIRASLIDGVIVTHCHADHDAGTFQKVLFEGQVTVITTHTIYESFIRKYSALSGLQASLLRKSHTFHPVTIGETFRVRGASFDFFYTLHSIPCIGFVVRFGNRSIAFSADHMNDPDRIRQMHKEGLLADGRLHELLHFPWHHDVIFHEAGIPPIHTPMKTLEQLPDDIKKRLYVVHVSKSSIPESSGLRVAPLGVENTVSLEVETPYYSNAVVFLDLLSSVAFFQEIGIREARDLLEVCVFQKVKRGEVIHRVGQPVEELVVVSKGRATVRYAMLDFAGCDGAGSTGSTASLRRDETADGGDEAGSGGGNAGRGARCAVCAANGGGGGSGQRCGCDSDGSDAGSDGGGGMQSIRRGTGLSRPRGGSVPSTSGSGATAGGAGGDGGGGGLGAAAFSPQHSPDRHSNGSIPSSPPLLPSGAAAAAAAAEANMGVMGAAFEVVSRSPVEGGDQRRESRHVSQPQRRTQRSSGKKLLARRSESSPPAGLFSVAAGSGAAAAAALSDEEMRRMSRSDSSAHADVTLMQGDWFGEEALLPSIAVSRVEVTAEAGLEVYKFRRNDLKWIMKGQSEEEPDGRVAAKSRMDRLFMHNSMLRRMSRGQKLQLESMAHMGQFKAGAAIWSAGAPMSFVVVVVDGLVAFELDDSGDNIMNGACLRATQDLGKGESYRRFACPDEFGKGALVGCAGTMLQKGNHMQGLRAKTDCRVLTIARAEMEVFSEKNPGVFLSIHDLEFIA